MARSCCLRTATIRPRRRFRELLPEIPLQPLGRADFYATARGPEVAVAVTTGEQWLYANILLTLGVVT